MCDGEIMKYDNKLVGMLCLNPMQSHRKLEKNFDLTAFNGFHKHIDRISQLDNEPNKNPTKEPE